MIDFLDHDIVTFCQLVDCYHQLIDTPLIVRHDQGKSVKYESNILRGYHSVCAIIYRMYCYFGLASGRDICEQRTTKH